MERKERSGSGHTMGKASRVDPREAALVAVLLLLAGASWVFTSTQVAGMDMGTWTAPGPLGLFTLTWVVMLAAMMFPSVAPMVVAYHRIQRHRRQSGRHAPAGSTAVFVGGYLASWTAFGLVAYALYMWAAALAPGVLAPGQGGRYVAAGVILLAALYQLTPAKNVSLMKCRSPMDFILHRMRPGYSGALRMGVEHGAWCVACCWALMTALFALGVMSVGWMALIGAFIAGEKMLPWKRLANRSIAVALALIALGVALAPAATNGMEM
ncbi:putative metal-binding integral membrane protein [Pseudarthrobacter phenanthrenivorans Sphe3]|uniref:Putative metal-binding integral membrane protein n=2 Tax=Pseudarthrobacter phenanthrenivorans TaxID=361575 RepID=F0M307_PSEPM|nr:putative metal-binding integral membrane protein [Pseudarthrobacter phenanthrenivorans Sphe3]